MARRIQSQFEGHRLWEPWWFASNETAEERSALRRTFLTQVRALEKTVVDFLHQLLLGEN